MLKLGVHSEICPVIIPISDRISGSRLKNILNDPHLKRERKSKGIEFRIIYKRNGDMEVMFFRPLPTDASGHISACGAQLIERLKESNCQMATVP
jgi:hypothetical protein